MTALASRVSDLASHEVMATLTEASLSNITADAPRNPSTLSPGHAAILEMHANSQSNAIIYVAVVLGLYVLGMGIVVIKYIRTERYEARLTRLFQNLVQRDRFFRLSRRRSSLPKCIVPEGAPEDDLPLSPVLQIPEITTSTVHTPSDPMVEEEESKV